jgi:SAM-dependent methyltransferase
LLNVGARISDGPYQLRGRIFGLEDGVEHREDEYDSATFAVLKEMQERHFWYRGRHRFLLAELRRCLKRFEMDWGGQRVIDMGGGCGGWIRYLVDNFRKRPRELALGDSSLTALEHANQVVAHDVSLYQIDLTKLGWRNRWDVAFLLDVLEHIPDHERVLREIRESLSPGAFLFITTPALRRFWTWNDDAVHHVRRYSKCDFQQLADACGYELLDAKYFMFFLSPLLLLSRWVTERRARRKTPEDLERLLATTHRVPAAVVNGGLYSVFATEAMLARFMSFPWGTSILAVLRRKND